MTIQLEFEPIPSATKVVLVAESRKLRTAATKRERASKILELRRAYRDTDKLPIRYKSKSILRYIMGRANRLTGTDKYHPCSSKASSCMFHFFPMD